MPKKNSGAPRLSLANPMQMPEVISQRLDILTAAQADPTTGRPVCRMTFLFNGSDIGYNLFLPVPMAEKLAHGLLTACAEQRAQFGPEWFLDETGALTHVPQ